MATGSLTALQLDAAAGLLQNQGIAINGSLIDAIDSYESTSLISPLLNTISIGNTGNILSNSTITSLKTLAANSCPALSDSVPVAYSALGTQMTVAVLDQATVDICGDNVSKLTQAVNQSQAYTQQTSTFINSAKNSQTYLADTFTSMNDMISGDVTKVSLATQAFGTDLQNLGVLIDLQNLDDFGSPLALVQQLYKVAGVIPSLTQSFVEAGIPETVALNVTSPTVSVIDSVQKTMYQVMTTVTGDTLQQILSVLRVTTVGINTMADLLNPVKLFPNSFQSLTAPTENGPVAIYIDSTGAVNTELTSRLPPYVVSSLV